MNKLLFWGSVLGVLVAASIGVIATNSIGATDVYPFLVRGIVTEVSSTANSVTAYSTHTSAKAKSDLAGIVKDFNVKYAKFYKWSNAKKYRVKISNVTVGDEVVMRGAKKSNGNFNVTKLTVNDRTFTVQGKIQGIDTTNRTMTINVTTSTYKQSQYKSKDVLMKYSDSTVFMSLGKVIEDDDVTASNQKVRVRGEIRNKAQWEITRFWDNVK